MKRGGVTWSVKARSATAVKLRGSAHWRKTPGVSGPVGPCCANIFGHPVSGVGQGEELFHVDRAESSSAMMSTFQFVDEK